MMALLRATALLQEPTGYDPARLYFTLAFMFVFVGAAVAFVRIRYPKRLIADIARTLGIFMLVIGTIVYTVAFRGLRPVEVIVAWVLSLGAIAWFVVKLNAIMSRPLTLLEDLASAVRRGDWAMLLRGDDGAAEPGYRRGAERSRCADRRNAKDRDGGAWGLIRCRANRRDGCGWRRPRHDVAQRGVWRCEPQHGCCPPDSSGGDAARRGGGRNARVGA